MSWLLLYIAVGWCIRLAMVFVVLRRQFTPGASIAWLGIVFLHPYIGVILYQFVGESRAGRRRVLRHGELVGKYALAEARGEIPQELAAESQAIVRLAMKVGRMPVAMGNAVEFFTESAAMVQRLAGDIAKAQSEVHLLYYIFSNDETGQRVATELKAAAGRGVKCRVLLDAFASCAAFRGNGLAKELGDAGVEVAAAMRSSIWRRRDLRNHRKLAVIDRQVAYTGSQNLINADYGGRRGAPWVDFSGRFVGPVVGEFASVFAMDWAFETDVELEVTAPSAMSGIEGGAGMQVLPTGPVSPAESFRRVFLGAVDSAEQRLILTTPYFVPDEPSMVALLTAADRGVDVSLIVPEKTDSFYTAAAGRAHFSTLLEAGVKIFLYKPGLIHAKIVTVDQRFGIMGSANLDVRSFHLNFELSVLMYGAEVTNRLAAVQQTYIENSRRLEMQQWAQRPAVAQYADDAVSLISPLL